MFDEEIEKAILYYIIFEKQEFIISENDFMNSRNKKIAKAILELKKEKEAISILSVKNKIKANSEQVLEYLSSLGNNIYNSNPNELYKMLIEMTKKRKVFDLAHQILKDVENENMDIYLPKIIKQINDISSNEEEKCSLTDQVMETIEQIENAWQKRDDKSLYTGIFDLDDKTCGLHNQEFTIIGARPRYWQNYACITNCPKNCTK